MPQINGQEVGPIGFGLMGLNRLSNPVPQEQAFEVMRTALKNGSNFWNGGEFYGTPEYNSLVLLERYFEKYPEDTDKVVISIKGAFMGHAADGSAAAVRRSIDNVLKLLNGRKKLDVFECARRDQSVSMEETFGEMQRYIDEGKLGSISLSEVRAETIHQAVKITKVSAVEVELSLFSPQVLKNGVAAACAQYNIPLIAYSPLGRGLLTGRFKKTDELDQSPFAQAHFPWFQPGNFEHNFALIHRVEELARAKGCTPGQFAIGWLRTLSKRPGMPTIIPIPGAMTVDRVTENLKQVELTDKEMDLVDEILETFVVKGHRYPEGIPTET